MTLSMRALLPLVASVLLSSTARAAVVHVPQDAELQAAFNAVVDGTTIVIAPGVYVGSYFVGGVDDLKIVAKGKVTLSSSSGPALIVDHVDGLLMKKLRFDASAGNGLELNTVSNASVIGCSVVHSSDVGFSVTAGVSIRLDKCVAKNADTGLSLSGSACLVRHMTLKDCDSEGITISGDGNLIEDCKLRATTSGIAVGSGPLAANRVIIADNDIRDLVGMAIVVSDFATETLVTGNEVSDVLGGIFVTADNTFTMIADNHVKNVDLAGVQVLERHVTVSNNRVENCASAGIQLDANADDTMVEGNVVKGGAGPHYWVNGSGNFLLENVGDTYLGVDVSLNSFVGNTFPLDTPLIPVLVRVPEDFATPQAAVDSQPLGCYVEVSAGDYGPLDLTTVSDVTVVRKGKGKVTFDGGASPAITLDTSINVRIEGLTLLSAASSATLDIDGCANISIEGCNVSASAGSGIVAGTCNSLRIANCTIEAPQSNGVELNGVACSLVDSRVSNCGYGVKLTALFSVIANCRIEHTTNNGFQLGDFGPGTNAEQIVVRDNVLDDVALQFMRLTPTSTGALLAGNKCTHAGEHGFYVDLNSVGHALVGNHITDTVSDGIGFAGDSLRAHANVVKRAGADGVRVDSMSNTSVWTRNVVKKSDGYGFDLRATTSTLVGNSSTKNGGDSVYDANPGQNVFTGNKTD